MMDESGLTSEYGQRTHNACIEESGNNGEKATTVTVLRAFFFFTLIVTVNRCNLLRWNEERKSTSKRGLGFFISLPSLPQVRTHFDTAQHMSIAPFSRLKGWARKCEEYLSVPLPSFFHVRWLLLG